MDLQTIIYTVGIGLVFTGIIWGLRKLASVVEGKMIWERAVNGVILLTDRASTKYAEELAKAKADGTIDSQERSKLRDTIWKTALKELPAAVSDALNSVGGEEAVKGMIGKRLEENIKNSETLNATL